MNDDDRIRIYEDIDCKVFNDKFSSTGESSWLPEYEGLKWGTNECDLGYHTNDNSCKMFQTVKNTLHDVHATGGYYGTVVYDYIYTDESEEWEFIGYTDW